MDMTLGMRRVKQLLISLSIALLFGMGLSAAYVPGDFVQLARRGQYHAMRTPWHDQLGRHCPRFGINSEVVLPLPKPTGYTGSDPYKIALQFGSEKYGTPWLFVIGRKGSEVPIIDVHLVNLVPASKQNVREVGSLAGICDADILCLDQVSEKYAGGDLLGVTAKVVSLPNQYLNEHASIKANFWDTDSWPKHVLVHYVWEEKSELDVVGGLYVLFGSGFVLTVFMALHILQSSKEKLSRFIKETVVDASLPPGEAKAD